MVHSKMIETELIRFLSDDIAEAQRLSAVQSFFRHFDETATVIPAASSSFVMCGEYQRWATVSLLFCQSTAMTLSWNKTVTESPSRDFRLFRLASGDYRIICDDSIERVDAGATALLSNASTTRLVIDQASSFTLMSVPRDLLPPTMRNLDSRSTYQIDANNPALRLLIAYQDFLRGKDAASDAALALKVAQHLVDLMAVMLTSAASENMPAPRAAREARLEAIKTDILTNLAQVRLSAKTVARRQGVTDRYIHKLFEETGETFGRYVMEERLKRAYKLLTVPPYNVPIGAIALEVGFGELSTFNRAFKRRFGDTPTGVRRKHSAEQTPLPSELQRRQGRRSMTHGILAETAVGHATHCR